MAVTALPFRYALATNAVAASFADFTAQNATATEPSGAGVIDLLSGEIGIGAGIHVPSYLQLIPFGTSADNQTFAMRLYGYNPTVPADLVTDTALYIPQLLLDVSVTLSAITFSDHAASTFLADTLVVNLGAADNGPWRSLLTAAATVNATASLIVHTRGCRYLKWDWDFGTAATANCLWRPFDF